MTRKLGTQPPAPSRARTWGRVVAALGVLVAVLLVFPGLVPNTPGHLGSLLETFLPWLGLALPVLLLVALLCRSRGAAVALLLPAVAWLSLFGGRLSTGGAEDGAFTVVQHNISDVNPDPATTARALAGTDADLVAVEELTAPALPAFAAALAADYPHHATRGTVGLWSKHPSPAYGWWTSGRREWGRAGTGACGPPSVPLRARPPCTSHTCPRSAWVRRPG